MTPSSIVHRASEDQAHSSMGGLARDHQTLTDVFRIVIR